MTKKLLTWDIDDGFGRFLLHLRYGCEGELVGYRDQSSMSGSAADGCVKDPETDQNYIGKKGGHPSSTQVDNKCKESASFCSVWWIYTYGECPKKVN